MKKGVFDRLLKAVGLRKIKAEGYRGAETSRLFWDWVTAPCKVDEEVRRDIAKLRARARDQARNNPIAQQYLSLLEDNVIGPNGFKHQSQVRFAGGKLRKQINDTIEGYFSAWGHDCTADGRMSFLALQKLLLRNTATDGEQFVKILRNRGSFGIQLQTLDPDLLDHQLNQEKTSKHGEIRLGVECDRLGRPLAYWFRESYDLGASLERIPASDIIHICRPDRLNQTRGVSWFSPVLVPLKMLDGLYEAILILNRLAASKMGFFVHKDAGSFDRTAYDAMSPVEAEPGSTIALPPGIEFQSWDTGNPSAELNAFSKLILRHIASGLKVSYVALSNDLEGVNYSSIRAGLLVERDQFRTLQQWWIDTFLRPVYVEWLKSASLSESWVILGRDWRMYQSVHFVPRGWPWVDPLKDIQATLLAINNNLGSRTDALAEGGKDIEEVFEKIAAERGLAAEFGIDLTIDDTKPQPDAEDDEEEPVVMAGGQSIVYNMTRKP